MFSSSRAKKIIELHQSRLDAREKLKEKENENQVISLINEQTTEIAVVNRDLFDKFNLRLVVGNLTHLGSYLNKLKGWMHSSDSLMEGSSDLGAFVLVMESLKTKDIIGLINLSIDKIKLIAGVNDLIILQELKDNIPYTVIFFIEMIDQLSHLNVKQLKINKEQFPECLAIANAFGFTLDKDFLFYNFDKRQHKLKQELIENCLSFFSAEKAVIDRSSAISIKDVTPNNKVRFKNKNDLRLGIPDEAMSFSYFQQYNVQLIFPKRDQILAASNLFLEGIPYKSYLNALLNDGSYTNKKGVTQFVFALQDIKSTTILAAIFFWFNEKNLSAFIDSMVVHEGYRRQNLSEMLLLAALERLQRLNCEKISLETTYHGQFVYLKYGFFPAALLDGKNNSDTSSESEGMEDEVKQDSDEDDEKIIIKNKSEWDALADDQKVEYVDDRRCASEPDLILELNDPKVKKIIQQRSEYLQSKPKNQSRKNIFEPISNLNIYIHNKPHPLDSYANFFTSVPPFRNPFFKDPSLPKMGKTQEKEAESLQSEELTTEGQEPLQNFN